MEMLEVEVARTVDRDQVLQALAARRIEAKPLDEHDGRLAIEVACADGERDDVCDELFAELEAWITEEGVPLVPLRANGSIFLRPPGD
jgi:hypothetical protein